MKDTIMVLRAIDPNLPEPLQPNWLDLGGDADSKARPAFKVETIDEDHREVSSIRQDKDVLAATEVMPLCLHRPVAQCDCASRNAEGKPWGLDAIGANHTPCSGVGAKIAILDTGIDRHHKAFEEIRNRKGIKTKDFTGEGDGDSDGHGTHCAGTIFGGYVEDELIGVASGVSMALVGKVIGRKGGSSQSLAEGIRWAIRKGANIISMSCGFDYSGMVERLVAVNNLPIPIATGRALEAYWATREFFSALAKQATLTRTMMALDNRKGYPILFVAAAGNSSRYGENSEFVVGVEPPASSDDFVSVGALMLHKQKRYRVADFSNGGVRVSGPGVNIISAKAGTTSSLASKSGTSMATPHVAGVAALWFEHLTESNEEFSAKLLADQLIGSARVDKIHPKRREDAGKGLVQAPGLSELSH